MCRDYEIFLESAHCCVRAQPGGGIVKRSRSAASAVQFACDRLAGHGGEIVLHRGRYAIDQTIHPASRVCLRGHGRATCLCVTQAPSLDCGIHLQNADGVVLADFAMVAVGGHAQTGIVLDDCGDCQVRNIGVWGFRSYGVWLKHNSFLCELNSVKASDNALANIYLEYLGAEHGRGGDFPPNLVTHCVTCLGGRGIVLNASTVVNIDGCQVFQPRGHAYHLYNESNSVVITGCRSFQAGGDAVLVENSHEFNASGNMFSRHQGHGIRLRGVAWGSIFGNAVTGTGRRDADLPGIGVVLKEGTRGVHVTGNSVINRGCRDAMRLGIWEDADCHHNLIRGNYVHGYRQGGISSNGRHSLERDNAGWNVLDFPRHPADQAARDFDTEAMTGFVQQLYGRNR